MRRLAAVLLLGSPCFAGDATAAETVRIAGIGASSCTQFNREIFQNPAAERDFFAWAQGFMSGALIRAPHGVDDDVDLLPQSFPLHRQADFLRSYCSDNPNQDYMDAVRALYHRLRGSAA